MTRSTLAQSEGPGKMTLREPGIMNIVRIGRMRAYALPFRALFRPSIAAAFVLLAVLPECPHGQPKTVYFMVSELEPFHNDSYILPLTDPDDIERARAIIADPGSTAATIVVAAIEPGPGDPPNQDLLNEGTDWSWHLTEFMGFAEITIEVLDGWPTFVEQDVDGWIQNTGGLIGFWSYTVTREVAEEEL